ncbi:alpha/beta fold hydrolase [Tenggerimyces flavus]|uniref:Alpha/beta fold hydrolase n=1 Tax=Tenggerimyces flavus TaxID=1708749 RepID=A0ABV7YNF8_9ACTN|nr:alpha/beta hydrolase [Tenggerimyces flavus]MBM7789677.1 pimeloyl-ACP methyl ester carboxylesterase [Tenggerimyces flavus]
MTDDAFAHPRTLRLDGGPLGVYEAGPADAPTVVLLHGAMLDTAALTWRHLMPALAARWNVLAVDLPRHGLSRPWTGRVDQPRMETVLDELLEQVGVRQTSLVGLSMGAGVALGYALTRPDRVSALVAMNPGGLDARRPWQLLTWLVLRSGALLRASTRWTAGPRYLRRTMSRHLANGTRTRDFDVLMRLIEAEARQRVEHREPALDDWQVDAYGPTSMRLDFTPSLPVLRMPSLWLHGRDDPLVTEGVMRRAAALAQNGEFRSVDGAGHLIPLDAPDQIAEVVGTFLDTVHGHGCPHP